jgi:hypothetical protein
VHENILFYFPKFGKNRSNIVVVVVVVDEADTVPQDSPGVLLPGVQLRTHTQWGSSSPGLLYNVSSNSPYARIRF